MGESILRDRIIPFESGAFFDARLSKGNQVNIPEPGRGYCSGNTSELGDAAGAPGRVLFSF